MLARFAAWGLDWIAPAWPGLAMPVRLGSRVSRHVTADPREGVDRRMQAFIRRKSMMRISDFRRGFPRCFYPMDPDEGASAWQRKRNGRDLVRPTTTDRLTAYLSILESCGLLKPSVDSLLAHRPSLRPQPMTTNRGNDSAVRKGFPNTGPGRSEAATFSSRMAHLHR